MSTERPGRPTRNRRRRNGGTLRVSLAALAGAAIALGVVQLAHNGWNLHRPHKATHTLSALGFRLIYPQAWEPTNPPKSVASAGPAVAALRQKHGTGLIIIRREKAAQGLDAKFVKDLDTRLRRQIPDYRPIRAQILHLKNGQALFYSYIRQQAGLLATITVIPAGDHSFALDTVSPASNKQVAAEIGQIIRSFVAT
jgi:hypothetical protein